MHSYGDQSTEDGRPSSRSSIPSAETCYSSLSLLLRTKEASAHSDQPVLLLSTRLLVSQHDLKLGYPSLQVTLFSSATRSCRQVTTSFGTLRHIPPFKKTTDKTTLTIPRRSKPTMKTAKALQSETGSGPGTASSSRRAQPVRQTRTNPPRSSALGAAANGRESGHEQPIDIFPAITHFTDSVTSLPKDLVRHFTLLKEVDAKIFSPEESLFQLIDAALKSNLPAQPSAANDASRNTAPALAPMSAQISINGSLPLAPSADENYNAAVYDPANLPRRQLFRQTAFKIQEMLVSLEEKNHVISTANDALSKQLARIDDVWPHLQGEFSDEAKWGSTTHWAYPENRAARASAAERSRRDGASAITAAAQQIADEAAARSDARKQAVAAKKGLKSQHQDSDLDADHENNKQHKNEPSKRQNHNSKSRKAAAEANANASIGLGITSSAPVNGNPPSKKRKVENNKDKDKEKDKATNGAQPMERALSGVLGNNNASKVKTLSPKGTPAPETGLSKKRKALPTVNSQSKKSKNGPASGLSPQIVSSPILPSFVESKNVARNSPAPTTTATRPASSRARQNSTVSSVDNAKPRPSSSASNRTNGALPPAPEVLPAQNGSRPTTDTKSSKETPVPVKTEVAKEATPQPNPTVASTAQGGSRKNSVAKEDVDSKGDVLPSIPQTVTTVVTTKSGRASKPSTPALGSFPESARQRTSRTTQTGAVKRSHKKGAAQAALAAQAADDDANSSAQGDDDGDIDPNERRYCFCNSVSYGEMVACDADDCEKEWFHLGCVGLRSAPSSSTKWYCDNCKNRMKNGKKVNGR